MKKLLSIWITFSMLLALGGAGVAAGAQEGLQQIVIEGEQGERIVTPESVITEEAALSGASGGKFLVLKTLGGQPFPEEGIEAAYSFTVEKAGEYQLSITAQDINEITLSPYAVRVDDGAYQDMTAQVIESTGDKMAQSLVPYQTNLTYTLDAGEHTFYLKVTGSRPSGDGRGWAHFDCATLTETAPPDENLIYIKGTSSHTKNFPIDGVGSEGYGTIFAANTLGLQTGSADPFPEEGLIVTYTFPVIREGRYQLTISASPFADYDYLSPYAIAVNDGPFTDITASQAGNPANPNLGWNMDCPVLDQENKYTIGIYETNLTYDLEAGENSISFQVTGPRKMDNKATACLAYLQLNRQERPEPQSSYMIKGPDAHTNNYAETGVEVMETFDLPGTINIKTATGTVFPSQGLIATYNLDCAAEGDYKFSISASAHTRTNDLSTYAVSVNGGPYTRIDADVAGESDAPNGGWNTSLGGDPRLIGLYHTNLQYHLNEGMNTVSFKVLTPRAGDGRGWVYLEYMKFTFLDTLDTVSLDGEKEAVEIGSQLNTIVQAVGEKGIALDLSGADLVYSSEQEEIAQVSETGVVTGKKYGRTNINVAVTIDGVTKTASTPVYVTAQDLYVGDVTFTSNGQPMSQYQNGKITASVTLRNYSGAEQQAVLLLAVYDSTGAYLSGAAKSCTVGAGGEDIPVSVTYDASGSGGSQAQLFIWDSVNGIRPLGEPAVK